MRPALDGAGPGESPRGRGKLGQIRGWTALDLAAIARSVLAGEPCNASPTRARAAHIDASARLRGAGDTARLTLLVEAGEAMMRAPHDITRARARKARRIHIAQRALLTGVGEMAAWLTTGSGAGSVIEGEPGDCALVTVDRHPPLRGLDLDLAPAYGTYGRRASADH